MMVTLVCPLGMAVFGPTVALLRIARRISRVRAKFVQRRGTGTPRDDDPTDMEPQLLYVHQSGLTLVAGSAGFEVFGPATVAIGLVVMKDHFCRPIANIHCTSQCRECLAGPWFSRALSLNALGETLWFLRIPPWQI